jgi:hypothetical protein
LDDGNLVATKKDPPYEVPWKGESEGRHDIRVRVFDKSGKQTSIHQNSLFVGIHGVRRTIEFSIDDAEEQEDGSIYLDSSDLELVRDSNRGDQVIGIRFREIAIPKDARITKAYLQFTCNEPGKEKTELSIRAERSPDASAFEKLMNNVSSRSVTDQSVKWLPEPWAKSNERTENQRTPDLAGLIQEIVSQRGWKKGNAVAFVITGSGQRSAISSDGPGVSSILHVEYEL